MNFLHLSNNCTDGYCSFVTSQSKSEKKDKVKDKKKDKKRGRDAEETVEIVETVSKKAKKESKKEAKNETPKIEDKKKKKDKKEKKGGSKDAKIKDDQGEKKSKKAAKETKTVSENVEEKKSTKKQKKEKKEKKKKKQEDNEEPHQEAPAVLENGNEEVDEGNEGDETQEGTTPGSAAKAFQRVKADDWLGKKGSWDNSYEGTFGAAGWGFKAQQVLGKVRGKDFRHEKTKKKRGSYRGGAIDPSAVCSYKFDSDDD